MHIFYYNTPIYREILLHFSYFSDKYYINRTPFHFDAVLKQCWGVFQRHSARLALARLRKVLYVNLSRTRWKSPATPQHHTVSKIDLRSMKEKQNHLAEDHVNTKISTKDVKQIKKVYFSNTLLDFFVRFSCIDFWNLR